MSEILLVDDDEAFRDSLAQSLALEGFQVREFSQGHSVLPYIKPLAEVIVVSDIRMPKLSGEQLRERVHDLDAEVPLLLMTGHGDVPMAVGNLRAGAFAFFSKPLNLPEVVEDCRRALHVRQAVVEKRKLAMELGGRNRLYERVQGSSKLIQDLRRRLSEIAIRDTNLVVSGETGVGKEVVARAIHAISDRSLQPFVAVNSALIDEPGAGQSLFGEAEEPGLFERAKDGTLFLDDVETMPAAVQSKLLRVLEERQYRKSGQQGYQDVRCRIVASAKPTIEGQLANGQFRDDLFYRLRAEAVDVPPLRHRKADGAMLFEHFVIEVAQETERPAREVTPEVLAWVMSQPWHGNVRELRASARQWARGEQLGMTNDMREPGRSLSEQVADFESALIQSALEAHDFDIRSTGETLKTPRKTLTDKIAKYGLGRRL